MSPALVGVGALLVALLIVELLIQLNFISRFIVPPPSEIVGSFGASSSRNMYSADSC